jgi:hypothetical protein
LEAHISQNIGHEIMMFTSLEAASRGLRCSQHLPHLKKLTPKGPRVFWCKTTQNYPLLKKEFKTFI